jgi:hypothetical protein
MPVVRDLLYLGDWRVLRAALRLWAHVPGSIPGTLCASSAEVVSQRDWDICAASTLAVVVLDKLLEDGWRVGTPPATHCMDTPRTFARPVRLGQHTYWRCLAMLDRLCAAGLKDLRSGMTQQYYSNVLLAYQVGSLPQLPMPQDGEPRRLQCVTGAGSSADMPSHAVVLSDEPIAPLGGARTGGPWPIVRFGIKRTRAAEVLSGDTAAAIATALGQLKEKQAVPWLVAAMKTVLSPVEAAAALGDRRDERRYQGPAGDAGAEDDPESAGHARLCLHEDNTALIACVVPEVKITS